jgi:gliding motility-associated-like protein
MNLAKRSHEFRFCGMNKKIILLSLIIPAIFASCKKEHITFPPTTIRVHHMASEGIIVDCFKDNEQIILDATTPGAITYQWNTGASTPTIIADAISPDYMVAVTTADTTIVYTATISYCGTTFFVPSTFTPHIGGQNDYFGPTGINFDLSKYLMKIYNQQMKCVYSTRDVSKPWNGGYHNHEQCPSGFYYYYFEYTTNTGEAKTKSGTVEKMQ